MLQYVKSKNFNKQAIVVNNFSNYDSRQYISSETQRFFTLRYLSLISFLILFRITLSKIDDPMFGWRIESYFRIGVEKMDYGKVF